MVSAGKKQCIKTTLTHAGSRVTLTAPGLSWGEVGTLHSSWCPHSKARCSFKSMRLAFSCGKGQSAWLGKMGGNTGRILQSWTNAVTSSHHFLFLKDPFGGPKGVPVFLRAFCYNWTWSACGEAKAQADKHKTDPSMLGISSFPTGIWLGRRKSLYKATETG